MLRNTALAWGWPAKALHWIAAAAIVMLLAHGWWVTHLAPRDGRLANYTWHAMLGYDLLAITVIRLLWRWLNPVPQLPADLKPWERLSAQLGHAGLYVLMLAASVSGWVLAGTFRAPMNRDLFGLQIPAIVSAGSVTLTSGADRALHELAERAHAILSWLLALMVIVHVIGALRHHLGKRNDILRRMTWGTRAS